VRLEGLGQLKNPVTSGIETAELPACSIVPQPTTLPHAPKNKNIKYLQVGKMTAEAVANRECEAVQSHLNASTSSLWQTSVLMWQ
jgi:hypothetical protein